MATLWIREYEALGLPIGGTVAPVAMEPGTDQEPLAFTATAQSAPFAGTTRFICINSSDDFHYVVGSNPIATTDALKWPANTPLYIGVTFGQKIAVIEAA